MIDFYLAVSILFFVTALVSWGLDTDKDQGPIISNLIACIIFSVLWPLSVLFILYLIIQEVCKD